ncbi:MAG TPA: hypothetical protein VIN56_11040 [Candidatus Dormibacteraeota bacterium]
MAFGRTQALVSDYHAITCANVMIYCDPDEDSRALGPEGTVKHR